MRPVQGRVYRFFLTLFTRRPVFVSAVVAKLGRTRVLMMLALPLLVAVQSILANSGLSWFRAFHPVVAVLILALAGSQNGRAWREERAH